MIRKLIRQIIVPKSPFLRVTSSFSSKIESYSIRNSNLRFDTDNYYIKMYPFYPEIVKKKEKNVYEVSTINYVLTLMFTNRNEEYTTAWENRKSISFRFKDLGKILSAEIGSGREVAIVTTTTREGNEYLKTLTIKDLKGQQKMELTLKNVFSEKSQGSDLQKLQNETVESQIKTTMAYSEYLIMYKIIENSLLDLSGWKFMMEVQKRQQINKLDNKIIGDKEVQELLKN